MRYSATHKTEHNRIYRLDAAEAYQQRLVKKIEAYGIKPKGMGGAAPYMFLETIQIFKGAPPVAVMEIEQRLKSGETKRQFFRIKAGDDLFKKSKGLC